MERLRFFALIAAFVVFGFFATRWLMPLGDSRLPTFHAIEVTDPAEKRPVSFDSDKNAARDELRNAVIVAAGDFTKDPCDIVNRSRYITAAMNYAHAWLAMAPCVASNNCGDSNNAELDRVQKAFGTPLDRRVQEAMALAHAARTVKASDLAPETVSLMASLASDPSLLAGAPGQLRPSFGPLAHAHCDG